ncbi:MAG: hypothetical protein ACE5G9_12095 [Nitrospinales bacterium]
MIQCGFRVRKPFATDTQIDQLAYELYDLTAREIAIVEGKDQG